MIVDHDEIPNEVLRSVQQVVKNVDLERYASLRLLVALEKPENKYIDTHEENGLMANHLRKPKANECIPITRPQQVKSVYEDEDTALRLKPVCFHSRFCSSPTGIPESWYKRQLVKRRTSCHGHQDSEKGKTRFGDSTAWSLAH